MRFNFSGSRLLAIIVKEFIQMKRDRVTFGMMIGIPLLQLILFGFAINMDPKHLPTAIVAADSSDLTRSILLDMENSSYFKILPGFKSTQQADALIRRSDAQFVFYIPPNFTQKLIHGDAPELLLEADATDPATTGIPAAVMQTLVDRMMQNFTGTLSYLQSSMPSIRLVIQQKYNPERITQYNIVPGLLGVVLTMTMVIVTSLAITRERERGTMEALLAMPVRPLEVMLGKIIPYILVGYIQVTLILIAAKYIFGVPINGSIALLFLACLPFIAANLAVGLTFSTFADNQLQASQLSLFFFLPSILLSGFMFPFHGMPEWAQVIGNCLPLTHFLLIVRGLMLKGNGWMDIASPIQAILIFFILMIIIGFNRYRQTLD